MIGVAGCGRMGAPMLQALLSAGMNKSIPSLFWLKMSKVRWMQPQTEQIRRCRVLYKVLSEA